MSEYQTTIAGEFSLSGRGLHTGRMTHVTVKPAAAGTGIVLRRVDLSPAVDIAARANLVTTTDHGTTVAVGTASVSTIEHMMSALHGMRIDNALVEVDGPEVPILDGSARLWVDGIRQVGTTTLDAERRYLRLKEEVRWCDAAAGIEMVATPAEDFRVECHIHFASDLIGSQSATLTSYDDFDVEIARCRTFVFLHEVEMLLAANLIKGGDLDNALVFVDKPLSETDKERLAALYGRDKQSITVQSSGVLNTITPYYANEPARHKLLDFVGDIYLLGAPVKGHFAITCPGHRANVALANAINNSINHLS